MLLFCLPMRPPPDPNPTPNVQSSPDATGCLPYLSVHDPASHGGPFLPGFPVALRAQEHGGSHVARHLGGRVGQLRRLLDLDTRYRVDLAHGRYAWSVTRNLNHWRRIYPLLRAALILPDRLLHQHEFCEGELQQQQQQQQQPPPTPIASPAADIRHNQQQQQEAADSRLQSFEEQLRWVLDRVHSLRHSLHLLRFLGVSRLSFVRGLDSGGWDGGSASLINIVEAEVRARFVRDDGLGDTSCSADCRLYCGRSRRLWMVVKSQCIIFMQDNLSRVVEVFMIDSTMSVVKGLDPSVRRYTCGFVLQNSSLLVSLSCNHCDYERLAEVLDRQCSEQRRRRLADPTAKQLNAWSPSRRHCRAKWYADGAAYFADVYEALESAKQEIFICDWWLTPELHLKRPDPEDRHQLVNVLQRRADAGVRIFILIYKELKFAVNTDSWYAKMMLRTRCPRRNIHILRHPNHLFNADLLWTHHEKLLVVDQRLAFFGGIDLCWGRWDTQRHPLTDQGDSDWPADCRPIGDVDAFNAEFPAAARGGGSAEDNTCCETLQDTVDFGDASPGLESPAAAAAAPAASESLDDSSLPSTGRQKRRGLRRFLSAGPRQDLSLLLMRHQHQLQQQQMSVSMAASPPVGEGNKKQKLRRFHTIEAYGNGNRPAGAEGGAYGVEGGVSGGGGFGSRQPRWHVLDDGQLQVRRLEARRVSNLWRGAIERMRIARGVRGQLRRAGAEPAAAAAAAVGVENNEDFVDSRRPPPDVVLETRNIQLFKGLDYVNWVVKEPFDLHQPNRDLVDRNEVPRMPWHDVACVVGDNAARDLARHFIQRWNFTVRDKGLSSARCPLLIPKAFAAVDAATEEAADEAAEAAAAAAVAAAAAASGGGKRRWRLRRKQRQRQRQFDYQMDGPDATGREPADRSGLSRLLPRFYNQVNILRSVGPWSAGLASDPEHSIHEALCSAIDNAEHFVYLESQFFISNAAGECAASPVRNRVAACLAARILRARRERRPFRAYLLLPLRPQFEEPLDDPRSMERTKKILHLTYRTLCRGADSLIGRLRSGGVEDHADYLAVCALRTWGRMANGRLATELIYVHSKLLIADDRVLVLGSANINDRSLLGCRDSELAMRYEDAGPDAVQTVWTVGDDNSLAVDVRVGAFCGSLRRCLMREHLGLLDSDAATCSALDNPLSEELFDRLWLARARANTSLFESVFRCLPTDSVRDYESLAAWLKQPPLAELDPDTAAQRLAKEAPGGSLVMFPLDFLANADLDDQISVVPPITWH